jgi:hypothetical protein
MDSKREKEIKQLSFSPSLESFAISVDFVVIAIVSIAVIVILRGMVNCSNANSENEH